MKRSSVLKLAEISEKYYSNSWEIFLTEKDQIPEKLITKN